jgi:hypothetical protein
MRVFVTTAIMAAALGLSAPQSQAAPAARIATPGGSAAQLVRHYARRYDPWSNPNFWGYGSLSHGGWGLGGPANWAFVGGASIPVTPYGPYPYGPFPHGANP